MAIATVYLGDNLSRYGFGDGHPFGPDRMHAFWRETVRQGLDKRVEVMAPVAFDEESLLRFHTPVNWMTCAFGPQEFNCLTQATNLGGHVRVGFENSLHLLTGEVAADNHQLITQLVKSGSPTNRPLADIHQARGILGDDVI